MPISPASVPRLYRDRIRGVWCARGRASVTPKITAQDFRRGAGSAVRAHPVDPHSLPSPLCPPFLVLIGVSRAGGVPPDLLWALLACVLSCGALFCPLHRDAPKSTHVCQRPRGVAIFSSSPLGCALLRPMPHWTHSSGPVMMGPLEPSCCSPPARATPPHLRRSRPAASASVAPQKPALSRELLQIFSGNSRAAPGLSESQRRLSVWPRRGRGLSAVRGEPPAGVSITLVPWSQGRHRPSADVACPTPRGPVFLDKSHQPDSARLRLRFIAGFLALIRIISQDYLGDRRASCRERV